MIVDTLKNSGLYSALNPDLDRVLKAAAAYTSDTFPKESVQLDGKNVFLNFCEYQTHPFEEAQFEAHCAYIDVFVIVEGCETTYVKETDALKTITKPYDPTADILFAAGEPGATQAKLSKGSFIVLFPQDAHAPGCHADGVPVNVKKIVGKIRIR